MVANHSNIASIRITVRDLNDFLFWTSVASEVFTARHNVKNILARSSYLMYTVEPQRSYVVILPIAILNKTHGGHSPILASLSRTSRASMVLSECPIVPDLGAAFSRH